MTKTAQTIFFKKKNDIMANMAIINGKNQKLTKRTWPGNRDSVTSIATEKGEKI